MKAVEYAVDGAGIATIGKQQRPTAGVAGEPVGLIAGAQAPDGCFGWIPGNRSQNGESGRQVNNAGQGSADLRIDSKLQFLAFDGDQRL